MTPAKLRAAVYRTHPCIARIIDLEDGRWDPTESYGGGHNVRDSYGLPQANPGTKLAVWTYTVGRHRAGAATPRSWATNPWVQVEWSINYAVGRYGSECGALRFRLANHWW